MRKILWEEMKKNGKPLWVKNGRKGKKGMALPVPKDIGKISHMEKKKI